MVVCKFYQAGNCRYGDNCRYEHIDPPGGARNNQTNDPFSTRNKRDNYRSDKKVDEEPQWPLSVIGIKDNSQQGNAVTGDWSPEELRAAAYSMAPRGLSAEVNHREAQLLSEHKAKVESLSRGSTQRNPSAGANRASSDPFARSGGGSGFGAFPVANGIGRAQHGFGQTPAPIAAPLQAGTPFGAPQSFEASAQQPFPPSQPSFVQAQQPPATQPISTPLSSAAQEQFSAAQFGFTKVPESAPPPQFY